MNEGDQTPLRRRARCRVGARQRLANPGPRRTSCS
jgi:hypothetical protein